MLHCLVHVLLLCCHVYHIRLVHHHCRRCCPCSWGWLAWLSGKWWCCSACWFGMSFLLSDSSNFHVYWPQVLPVVPLWQLLVFPFLQCIVLPCCPVWPLSPGWHSQTCIVLPSFCCSIEDIEVCEHSFEVGSCFGKVAIDGFGLFLPYSHLYLVKVIGDDTCSG